MSDDFDYGTARSTFLEEVRTILSRAETALRYLECSDTKHPNRYYLDHPKPLFSEELLDSYTWTDRHGKEHTRKTRKLLGYSEGEWIPHPGFEEGVAALKEVVDKLSKFRKTGRRKK